MAVNWLLSVLSRLLSAKRSAFHLLVYVHFCLCHRPYFCLSWCTLSSPPLDMLITSSLSAAQFIYWFRCYDKRRGSKCNPYFTLVNFLSWWNFCILIFTAAVKKLTKLRRDLCRPACIHVCPTFFLNNCSSTWHQAWRGGVYCWGHKERQSERFRSLFKPSTLRRCGCWQ